MSMTLIERHGVATSSSAVHSSSRCRVARPRRPGTRPSVVAISSGSSASGMADHGTEGRARRDGASEPAGRRLPAAVTGRAPGPGRNPWRVG